MNRWYLGVATSLVVGCSANYNQVFAPVQTNNITATAVLSPMPTAAPDAPAFGAPVVWEHRTPTPEEPPSPVPTPFSRPSPLLTWPSEVPATPTPKPSPVVFKPVVFKGSHESGLQGPVALPKGPINIYARLRLGDGEYGSFSVALKDQGNRYLELVMMLFDSEEQTKRILIPEADEYYFDVDCDDGSWTLEIGGKGATASSNDEEDEPSATPAPTPAPSATPVAGPDEIEVRFATVWYSPTGNDRDMDVRNAPPAPPGYVEAGRHPDPPPAAGHTPEVGEPVTAVLEYRKKQ